MHFYTNCIRNFIEEKKFSIFWKPISRTFPGLRLNFLKFMNNPFTPKISMFILLTVCHTFHIFALSLNIFQELSRTGSLVSSPEKCNPKPCCMTD